MSLNFGFNIGVILHSHPEIEISFKFIPKILMSKKCIHFLGPLCIYLENCELRWIVLRNYWFCIIIRIKPENILLGYCFSTRGRDSSVVVGPRYGLDGPGIESRWGRNILHPPRPALVAHPDSYAMGTRSLSRG